MKILNLYAGIGGNRKLWGDEHEITAVEWKAEIAEIYHDFFPNDKIVVGDAHQYLLDHYNEFDLIWSSPPCPSHSIFRKGFGMANGARPLFPDMKLYEEIIFLRFYFQGKYVVENVKSYYDPLIAPQIIQRHYFWSNFFIEDPNLPKDGIDIENDSEQIRHLQERYGFDLSKINGDKKRMLRNCVEPELGQWILEQSLKKPLDLFTKQYEKILT